jgi:hypothetical protein
LFERVALTAENPSQVQVIIFGKSALYSSEGVNLVEENRETSIGSVFVPKKFHGVLYNPDAPPPSFLLVVYGCYHNERNSTGDVHKPWVSSWVCLSLPYMIHATSHLP